MASTAMNREVLSFDSGLDYLLALKYGTGKQVSNGRVMFTTVENEVFFLDPDDADKIYDLKLVQGEKFRLVKRGNSRNAEITVSRVYAEQPVVMTPAAPAIAEQKDTGSAQQSLTPQASTPLSKLMASSYIAAIDALMIARDYAETKGVTFKITSGEIRSAAHCIYISSTKNGVMR